MISHHWNDSDCFRVFAEDQRWDAATLQQLREEYNIFFMSNGKDAVNPLMVIPRGAGSPLIVVGWEDDGQIGFNKNEYGNWVKTFSAFWIDSFIDDLLAAKRAVDSGHIKDINLDED